jgi:hypothetical protein
MTFKGQTMTQSQALTNALLLALIAPSDEKANQASDLAESIAQGLDFAQVEQCKADALAMTEGATQ